MENEKGERLTKNSPNLRARLWNWVTNHRSTSYRNPGQLHPERGRWLLVTFFPPEEAHTNQWLNGCTLWGYLWFQISKSNAPGSPCSIKLTKRGYTSFGILHAVLRDWWAEKCLPRRRVGNSCHSEEFVALEARWTRQGQYQCRLRRRNERPYPSCIDCWSIWSRGCEAFRIVHTYVVEKLKCALPIFAGRTVAENCVVANNQLEGLVESFGPLTTWFCRGTDSTVRYVHKSNNRYSTISSVCRTSLVIHTPLSYVPMLPTKVPSPQNPNLLLIPCHQCPQHSSNQENSYQP